jgi:hypothetical protein
MGSELFTFLLLHRLPWQVSLGGFPQTVEANFTMLPQINPPPLLPNSSAVDIR